MSIVKKTESLILVVPIAVMYFWSIYGAWDWIPMKLSGGYDFYEDIMFEVNIDEYYFEMLLYYSLFILIFSNYTNLKAKHLQKHKGVRSDLMASEYFYNINALDESRFYKGVVYICFGCFVYFSLKNIGAAVSEGVSAYQLSRFNSVLGGADSLVEFSGDMFLFLAIPLIFSKKKLSKKYILIPIVIFYIVNMLLGNRNTLLCGLVEGVLLFVELYGLRTVFRPRNIALGISLLTLIQVASFIRGLPVSDILAGNFELNIMDIFRSTSGSGEKYAAQISMYGVLSKDVPLSFGASIISFISILLPSFIGFPRLDNSYLYYVNHTMGGKPELGVTLNHITDWFINFGVVGLFIGAYVWGYVIKCLYRKRDRFEYFMASILFSSVSIQLIRGGIEGYKGTLLMNTIIPLLLIRYCIRRKSNMSSIV